MSHLSGAKEVALRQKALERQEAAYPKCIVCGDRNHHVTATMINGQQINVCHRCTGQVVEHLKKQQEFTAQVKRGKFRTFWDPAINPSPVIEILKTREGGFPIHYFQETELADEKPQAVHNSNDTHPELRPGEVFFCNSSKTDVQARHPEMTSLRRGIRSYSRLGKPMKNLHPWFVSTEEYSIFWKSSTRSEKHIQEKRFNTNYLSLKQARENYRKHYNGPLTFNTEHPECEPGEKFFCNAPEGADLTFVYCGLKSLRSGSRSYKGRFNTYAALLRHYTPWFVSDEDYETYQKGDCDGIFLETK